MAPIEVIYENGVFRPLRPVELPEGALGQVVMAPTSSQPSHHPSQIVQTNGAGDESPGRRAYRLLMEIAALPHRPPDELTDIGVRHDDILYPKHGRMP
jgi:predicted DNA-binding antitoxin AbrB/MazE fold protein